MVHLKRCLALFFVALCAFATTIVPLADISGSGTAQRLSGTAGAVALWVQIVAPSTNSSVVRVGDSTVSSTSGILVAPGGGFFLPALTQTPGIVTRYDLSTIYVLVQSGDKVSAGYGK